MRVVWIHRECDRRAEGAPSPPQENKTMKHVIWRMMVAIEEMQGLDTSWGVFGENAVGAQRCENGKIGVALD